LICLIVLLASLPVEAQTFQHVWSKPIAGDYSFDGKWIVGRLNSTTLIRYRGSDGSVVDTITVPFDPAGPNDVAVVGDHLVILTRTSSKTIGLFEYNTATSQWDTLSFAYTESDGDSQVGMGRYRHNMIQLAQNELVAIATEYETSEGPGWSETGLLTVFNVESDTGFRLGPPGEVRAIRSSGDGTRLFVSYRHYSVWKDLSETTLISQLYDLKTLASQATRDGEYYSQLYPQPMGEGTLLRTASDIIDMSTNQVISTDHPEGRLGYSLKGPNHCVGYIPDDAEQIGIPIIIYDVFTRESIAIDTLAYSSEAPHWPYVWGSEPAKVIHVRYNGMTHRYTYDSLPPPATLIFTVSDDTVLIYDTITVNAVSPSVNITFVAFDGTDTIPAASSIRVTSAWEQDTSLRYILKYPNGTTREIAGPTLHFQRPEGSDFIYRARTPPILHMRAMPDEKLSVALTGYYRSFVNGKLFYQYAYVAMATDTMPQMARDNEPERLTYTKSYPAGSRGRFTIQQNAEKYEPGDPSTPRYNTQYIYYQPFTPDTASPKLVEEFDWNWGSIVRPNDSQQFPSRCGDQHLYQFHYNRESGRWVILFQMKRHQQSWVNDPVGIASRLSSVNVSTQDYSGVLHATRGVVFSVDTEHGSDAVVSHNDHVDAIDLVTGNRRILIDSFPGGGIIDAKLYGDDLLVTTVGIFRNSGGTWTLSDRWPFADGWDVIRLNDHLACVVRHNADTVGMIVDVDLGTIVRWLGASHGPARTGEFIKAQRVLMIGDEHGVITGYYLHDLVGVEEEEEAEENNPPFIVSDLLVYPSITSDRVTIELPNDAQNLQVVNLLGEVADVAVQQVGENHYTLSTAGLAPGPYYVMARRGDELMYGRFIVQ